jgi:hypothetical protein
MAFIGDPKPRAAFKATASLLQACDDYQRYITHILRPAKNALEAKIATNDIALHEAFGANLIVAHSVDYLLAVRAADGIEENRKDLILMFDEKFSVPGAYLSNRKMELVDAINNAVKHVRLDPKRYKSLGKRYGQISFQSLVEDEGRIMCHLDNYRFDYCRVVLRPTLAVLAGWELNTHEDVLEFARGGFVYMDTSPHHDIFDPSDPSTAIDQMIELCSSPCKNCEETAEDCRCSRYVFAGESGRYEPLYQASEGEFAELMSHISPSYRRA